MREPAGASGRSTVEARDHGAKVEPTDQQTKVKSCARGTEVEPGCPYIKVALQTRKPKPESTAVPPNAGPSR